MLLVKKVLSCANNLKSQIEVFVSKVAISGTNDIYLTVKYVRVLSLLFYTDKLPLAACLSVKVSIWLMSNFPEAQGHETRFKSFLSSFQ